MSKADVLPTRADQRPQKDFWAPGEYLTKCTTCRQQFIGDKRAAQCAPCAYGDDKRFHQFGQQVWGMITNLGGEFCGNEISEDILPMAESAGLCERVIYDPELHGQLDADPGDEVWWWGDAPRTDGNAEVGPLRLLTRIPTGDYPCAKWYQFWKRGGWISVDHEDGETTLMWTRGKTWHSPIFGRATSVVVDNQGNMTSYYESAFSMWLVWGHERGTAVEYQRGLTEALWVLGILREATGQHTHQKSS